MTDNFLQGEEVHTGRLVHLAEDTLEAVEEGIDLADHTGNVPVDEDNQDNLHLDTLPGVVDKAHGVGHRVDCVDVDRDDHPGHLLVVLGFPSEAPHSMWEPH